MELNYTNGPAGYTASTPGAPPITSSYGGSGDVMDFFKEMARRRLNGAGGPQPVSMMRPAEPAQVEKSIAPGWNRVETPWSTWQGAATRPVGGPGIVPGMLIDPTKLPPSMRPDAAGISGARGRVPTGSVDSPNMDAAASSVQNTNVDPYELIRRRDVNSMYGR